MSCTLPACCTTRPTRARRFAHGRSARAARRRRGPRRVQRLRALPLRLPPAARTVHGIPSRSRSIPCCANGRHEPARREAWLRDQYQHPEEHRHTLAEVKAWFAENGIEYLRAYPSAVLERDPANCSRARPTTGPSSAGSRSWDGCGPWAAKADSSSRSVDDDRDAAPRTRIWRRSLTDELDQCG